MELSVCIITKNESAKLKRLLESIKDKGAEIVVVDTGSSDDTMRTAAEYTDRIYEFEWCGDFAAARNFSLQKAQNDLVMVLDSDEYVSHFSFPKDAPLESIGRISILNKFSRNGENFVSKERVGRIFHKSFYHYEGRVHERPVRNDGKEVSFYNTDIEIIHDGYDGSAEQIKEKAKRNEMLLLSELKSNQGDVYLLYQLGKSAYMAGDYEGAAGYFARAEENGFDVRYEYTEDLIVTYGYALVNSGKPKKAIELEKYFAEYDKSADFAFMMGLVYMNNELFEKACDTFLLATTKEHEVMKGTGSYLAFFNAGVINECLGNLPRAREFYQKCGDYEKAQKRLRNLQKFML